MFFFQFTCFPYELLFYVEPNFSDVVDNVDVSIDRSNVSDLSNANTFSDSLFQSQSFQASLFAAVQRAHQTHARTQQSTVDFAAPPQPLGRESAPKSLGCESEKLKPLGRESEDSGSCPLMQGETRSSNKPGMSHSQMWRLPARLQASGRPRTHGALRPTSTITAPPSVPTDPYGADGTVVSYSTDVPMVPASPWIHSLRR